MIDVTIGDRGCYQRTRQRANAESVDTNGGMQEERWCACLMESCWSRFTLSTGFYKDAHCLQHGFRFLATAC